MAKWQRLDRLLAHYMTPPMTAAGFTHAGRSYLVESANGNLVLVAVRGMVEMPQRLNFVIEWAAVPKALRDYHGSGPKARPQLDWGLLNNRLEVPPDLRAHPARRSEWILDNESERARFGARLEQTLRSQAIPHWLAMLDRDYLLRAQGYGYFDGPGLREAILYVDDGGPAQVSRWLDQASELSPPPDDRIVDWLRKRLAAR